MPVPSLPAPRGTIEPDNVPTTTETPTLFERVDAALERIRPAIQADGGDVWLMRIEESIAYVQMVGACGGCAAALVTLKSGIEQVVRAAVPEISAVEQL